MHQTKTECICRLSPLQSRGIHANLRSTAFDPITSITSISTGRYLLNNQWSIAGHSCITAIYSSVEIIISGVPSHLCKGTARAKNGTTQILTTITLSLGYLWSLTNIISSSHHHNDNENTERNIYWAINSLQQNVMNGGPCNKFAAWILLLFDIFSKHRSKNSSSNHTGDNCSDPYYNDDKERVTFDVLILSSIPAELHTSQNLRKKNW